MFFLLKNHNKIGYLYFAGLYLFPSGARLVSCISCLPFRGTLGSVRFYLSWQQVSDNFNSCVTLVKLFEVLKVNIPRICFLQISRCLMSWQILTPNTSVTICILHTRHNSFEFKMPNHRGIFLLFSNLAGYWLFTVLRNQLCWCCKFLYQSILDTSGWQ